MYGYLHHFAIGFGGSLAPKKKEKREKIRKMLYLPFENSKVQFHHKVVVLFIRQTYFSVVGSKTRSL